MFLVYRRYLMSILDVISMQLDCRWHIMFWGTGNIKLILCIFHLTTFFLPFYWGKIYIQQNAQIFKV